MSHRGLPFIQRALAPALSSLMIAALMQPRFASAQGRTFHWVYTTHGTSMLVIENGHYPLIGQGTGTGNGPRIADSFGGTAYGSPQSACGVDSFSGTWTLGSGQADQIDYVAIQQDCTVPGHPDQNTESGHLYTTDGTGKYAGASGEGSYTGRNRLMPPAPGQPLAYSYTDTITVTVILAH